MDALQMQSLSFICREWEWHHLDKFFKIDLTIAVCISLPHHSFDIFVSQLLSQVVHYLSQLILGNRTVPIRVKNIESFPELWFDGISAGIISFENPQTKTPFLTELSDPETLTRTPGGYHPKTVWDWFSHLQPKKPSNPTWKTPPCTKDMNRHSDF